MTNNQYLTLKDLIKSLNRLDKIDEEQVSKIRSLLNTPITNNVYSELCSIITKILIESEETTEEKGMRLDLQSQLFDVVAKHWPTKNYDVEDFDTTRPPFGTNISTEGWYSVKDSLKDYERPLIEDTKNKLNG